MPAVRRWVSVAANSQTVGIMLGSPGTPVCHGHVSEPATPSWHEATFRWDSPVNRRDQTAAETKRKGVVKSDGKKSGHRSVAAFSLSDAAAMAASCYRRLCRSSSAGHGTFAGGRGEPFASGTLSPVTAWHFPASLGAAIPSALVAHCRSDSMSQERLGRGSVRSDPGIRSGMGPTQPAASVVTATRTNVRRRRTVWSRVEVMAITPEVGATGRLPQVVCLQPGAPAPNCPRHRAPPSMAGCGDREIRRPILASAPRSTRATIPRAAIFAYNYVCKKRHLTRHLDCNSYDAPAAG